MNFKPSQIRSLLIIFRSTLIFISNISVANALQANLETPVIMGQYRDLLPAEKIICLSEKLYIMKSAS
jgi:ethanolamine utilization cobalamin adenosyltransferase